MKSILFTLMLSFGISITHATPKMWIKGANGKVLLSIEKLESDITLTGDLVETVFTLRFRNATNRMQEGEFVLPLPEGATISSYALEVNGALRAGVAVEKEQARHAYESIKRQMIDPGLVEREKGNIYRTRIFPIPANGTKLVRIGYIEKIVKKLGKFHYQLPTNYPGVIGQVTYRIHHEKNESPQTKSNELTFQTSSPHLLVAQGKQMKLTQPLEFTWNAPKPDTLVSETIDGETTHHLTFKVPKKLTSQANQSPKHVHLIWDASASCQSRDPAVELALLDAYFRNIQTTRVTLQLLRNQLSHAGSFTVTDGNWTKLRRRLTHVFYDGASNFRAIAEVQPAADTTIIVTDGENSRYINTRNGQLTHILHRSSGHHLTRSTIHDHGVSINLTQTPLAAALRLLTHSRYQLKGVNHNGKYRELPLQLVSPEQTLSITYRNRQSVTNSITLVYANANGERHKQSASVKSKQTSSRSLVTRHWAQTKLNQLEITNGQPEVIIDHCRKHQLVSDHTSLIVLERFQDYVNYNIPPPEPELRKKWRTARARIKPRKKVDYFSSVWNHRILLGQRSYSWLPPEIIAYHRQANIWLKAVATAFRPANLNPEPIRKIENWKSRTADLVRSQPTIKSTPALKQWMDDYKDLVNEWNGFRDLPAKRQADKQVAVSIRGLVMQPRTYYTDKALTLKQSIPLAGGFNMLASPMNVSLYRNGHATTYNIASKKFKDIPLITGDMVVAGPEPYDDSWGDPFGGGGESTPVDPSTQPAISPIRPAITLSDIWGSSDGGSDPFGGPSSRRKKSGDPVLAVSYIRPFTKPPKLSDKDWKVFETDLDKPGPAFALAAYKKLLSHHPRTTEFYGRTSASLAKHGHRELATQVISNISEPHGSEDLPALRSRAYHLIQYGLHAEAAQLLKDITRIHGESTSDMLLLAQNQHLSNQNHEAKITFHNLLGKSSGYRAAIDLASAVSDLYQFHTTTHSFKKIPAADIRCVLFSSNLETPLRLTVHEPIGHTSSYYRPSSQGGNIHRGNTIEEYILHKALPGVYRITCQPSQATTVHAIIYRHWGTPQQTITRHTVELISNKPQTISEITVQFP